ncbi:MAG: hypothetical protein HFE75_08355 [Firmicutes bacterium]|nr:hypothetical protein [Bacillota bacterium]
MSMACLYAAAFFLQPPLTALTAYRGIGPDLVLCLTVMLVVMGKEPGPVAAASIATALVQDICYSLYAGPGGAAMLAAVACAALAFRLCAWEGPWLILALTALETMVYHMVLWAGCWVFGAPWSFFHMVQGMPIWILYNGILCAGTYMMLTRERKETHTK